MELNILIKQFRKERKLTQQALGDIMGVSRVAVIKWENGENKPSTGKLSELAAALGVSFSALMGEDELSLPEGAVPLNGKGHQVPILGQVQAGAWRPVGEIVEPHEVSKFVTFYNSDYPINKQYGLKVVGDSMNLVVLEGSYVICINIDEGIPSPAHGDFVVAEHVEDGQMETTVKKLALTLDGVTLLPCSSNQDYKALVLNSLPVGCEVKIKARVIGAVQEF